MSCGAGRRRGSDPMWLWLCLAAAALIRPLAWEHSYATGGAIKSEASKQKGYVYSISIYAHIQLYIRILYLWVRVKILLFSFLQILCN